MNSELDLNTLEELLETMEPAEIRARYGDQLSPRGLALLTSFESLPGDLADLKAMEVPPAPSSRPHPFYRWSRWVTPLAAVLVLGIALAALFLPEPAMEAFKDSARPSTAMEETRTLDELGPRDNDSDTAGGAFLPEEEDPAPRLRQNRDKVGLEAQAEKADDQARGGLKKQKRRADRTEAKRAVPIETPAQDLKEKVVEPTPAPQVEPVLERRVAGRSADQVAKLSVALGERKNETPTDALASETGSSQQVADSSARELEDMRFVKPPGNTNQRAQKSTAEEAAALAELDYLDVTDPADGDALIKDWLFRYETHWLQGQPAPVGLFKTGTRPDWPGEVVANEKPPFRLQFLRNDYKRGYFVLKWSRAENSGELLVVLDDNGACLRLRPLP